MGDFNVSFMEPGPAPGLKLEKLEKQSSSISFKDLPLGRSFTYDKCDSKIQFYKSFFRMQFDAARYFKIP